MASESILVGVRVRKLLDREFKKGSQVQWEWDGGRSQIWAKSVGQQQVQKFYNYDRVFTPSDGNDSVYEQLAAPVIASVIQGFNATIFAYGQTASGLGKYTFSNVALWKWLLRHLFYLIHAQINVVSSRNFLLLQEKLTL